MFKPPQQPFSESLAGSLLLAHPVLRDPNFRRTAVLISSHDAEGAMGVVLNRPLQKKLGDFGMDFALGSLSHIPVFAGGPVAPRQLILCAWRPQATGKDGFEVEREAGRQLEPEGEGMVQLLFGLDASQASELVDQPGVVLRAFLGHAGWGAGQLEGEIKRDTWVVTPVLPTAIYSQSDSGLWKKILSSIDPHWCLLANEPDDVTLN